MSVEFQLPPKSLDDILHGKISFDVEEDPMVVWDKGLFLNELQRQGLVLSTSPDGAVEGDIAANTGLKKGTYNGTQKALTEVYKLVEEAHVSLFDSEGFEPIIPEQRALEQKKAVYQWSKDDYPPHLQTIPPDQSEGAPNVGEIFNKPKREFVTAIAKIFSFIIPKDIEHQGTPYAGPMLADVEKYNRNHAGPNTDIMEGKNIGDREDWYTDTRFAHQHLSGVNPTTIKTAPPEKVKAYIDQAGKQGLEGMKKLLSEGRDLLIQDYSYFREATGVTNEEVFMNTIYDPSQTPQGKAFRYACAPIVIFQLHEDGQLHPLAITLDYKGTLDKSITIFNRRLNPDHKIGIDEKDDWPWRYAKTCAQTADWAAHEIAVHLVDTHLVEEAIIVATNRTIPEDHLLYEILSPHWYRTLALNAAARQLLVPAVIARLAGFGPTNSPQNSRAFGLVNWSYKNFNFQEKYIPNDLKKRGFNLDTEHGNKYRNYPYASCMSFLWQIIREFVKKVLETEYKDNKDVQNDPYIPLWCKEIQTDGQITTFPSITTVDQLIDAVTMCIHIASPQHTAVNYLQDYYYSFVPSKPPALCTPLPKDLNTLQTYTEKDLVAALPIGMEGPKWKDWLLAAQLPELLSFRVNSDYSLLNYARSLYNLNKGRTAFENKKFKADDIKKAAASFYSQLKDCDLAFQYFSAIQSEGSIEYKVLQPELTAVSILI